MPHVIHRIADRRGSRLAIAQQRSARGLLSPDEIALFQKGVADAENSLSAERKRLEESEATALETATAK